MAAQGVQEEPDTFLCHNYIILLPLKAVFVEGMISGVMEADKDEHWEKATG